MIQNIHATCIQIKSKGILFIGDSGSGKSDIALRLINLFSAKLVSDDRTDVFVDSKKIKAKAPDILKGLLEVRGVGIINTDCVDETEINLIIKLTTDKIERMPSKEYFNILGIKVPLFYLNPFESSATSKVISMLSLL